MKLDIKAFALTCAILWSAGLLGLTWWIIALDGPGGDTGLLGRVYRGYEITAVGSLIGAVWAFFDALIGGALLAWLYNKLIGCCAKPAETR